MKECNALQRILYGSPRDSKGSINKVYKGLEGSMIGTIRDSIMLKKILRLYKETEGDYKGL